VQVSTNAEYALRAAVVIAAAPAAGVMTSEAIAEAEGISVRAIQPILAAMRRGGILHSRRGQEGGYVLARAAAEISVADVMRAVDGPLLTVRGSRPDALRDPEPGVALQPLWIALRSSIRRVAEAVTLADLASGELPEAVRTLVTDQQPGVTRPSRRG